VVALTFIGLPFLCARWQPVLEDFDREIEESAASLGANRWQTFWRVTLPMLRPGVADGSRLHSRARWANTARSFSSPATCP